MFKAEVSSIPKGKNCYAGTNFQSVSAARRFVRPLNNLEAEFSNNLEEQEQIYEPYVRLVLIFRFRVERDIPSAFELLV